MESQENPQVTNIASMYIEPIRALIRECFWEPWMNNEDWDEFTTMLFAEIGSSYEHLAEQVVVGVKNGYSAQVQLSIMRDMLKGRITE